MITISLCMIVKNEEDVLARCLDSVKDLVEEIIIVDTGSTDKTRDIAYRYTDKVYDFEWVNDFSKARNFAFSKATKDYQMWLDADDVITKDNGDKIKSLKRDLEPSVDIVTFRYYTHFDEYGTPTLTSTRGRLFKREKKYKWNDPVHEYIELIGKIFYANDIYVCHKKQASYTDRNLKIYQELVEKGHKLSPRGMYYLARELKDHQRYACATYYFEEFLEGGWGWKEDNISACFNLSVCYFKLNNDNKILPILLKSFEYDVPRAEITCQIGYYYKQQNDYTRAKDWFLLSTKLQKPDTLGFVLNDYWEYIPYIELCVCYYKLGDVHKSILYNEKAAQVKPTSKAVILNRKFFEKS